VLLGIQRKQEFLNKILFFQLQTVLHFFFMNLILLIHL